MTVQIDRYNMVVFHNGEGHITDLLHGENIIQVKTRNKVLTRVLLERCLDYLNQNEESND